MSGRTAVRNAILLLIQEKTFARATFGAKISEMARPRGDVASVGSVEEKMRVDGVVP
jgi:hypothetical protein